MNVVPDNTALANMAPVRSDPSKLTLVDEYVSVSNYSHEMNC